MSAPVLTSRERNILRALVVGLALKRCAGGWTFGTVENADLDDSEIQRLARVRLIAVNKEQAVITEHGHELLGNQTADLFRKALVWLRSPASQIDTS